MLYEWLNRSHIVEWWGGEEARPTLADVQEQYLPSVLAQSPSSIHCNAEWRADWVCPVVRCSWKRGRTVGRRNRSRSTRNRPVTGECITTGQRLGNKLVRLWLSCCSMIPGHQDPNGPVAEQLASDPMLRKRGLRGRYRNHPIWSSRVMVQTRQAFERTRSDANPSIEGTSRAGALGRLMSNVGRTGASLIVSR